ncbi:MAG: Ig-like domain-containing protein, partial [candidate division WOR-3 bacterium]
QHWSNTKNFLLKLSNWIKTKTNSTPSAIVDGYDLQGNTIGQYNNAAFVGPFAVGAMCDSSLQQWLNSLFERLVNFSVGGDWGYYQDHLRLLTMLVLTGNFPNLLEMSSSQPTNYTLTVNISPQAAGTVSLNPSGGIYQSGTQVTLTATANSGWQFNSWSGAITGTQNPAIIVMDSNKTVTANFKDIQPPQVSITNPANNANISGTVEIRAQATDNSGISKVLFYINNICVSTDTTSPYSYSWNTTNYSNGQYIVRVEAFDTSGNTSYAQITITVNNTGNIEISTYTVNINIQPQGAGNVNLNPPGGVYQAGTSVTLTATANPGYIFSHWSGDLTGTQVVATILVDSNKNITANFSTQQQTELPSLVINYPLDNSIVSGVVAVDVYASSNYGISKVEFYIDGELIHTDLEYPYVFYWDTTYYQGIHTIYIVAFDNQNNYNIQSVTVSVASPDNSVSQEKSVYIVYLNREEKVYFDKEYDFVIFDAKGKIIRRTKSIFWDCKDDQGKNVPIGFYLFKLNEDFNYRKFGKIIVLK